MSEYKDRLDETRSLSVLPPGTKVSQFKIIKKIGSGGMAEVYLAEDTALQRKVTLKFLLEQYASEPEIKARFTQEARAAANLNHPNIITIHEVAEYQNRPYIAMEYLPGGSLKDLMARRELGLKEIIDIGIQVGEGLNLAHESGIVHRDIKPQNLLLDKEGRVKVADFGLAKVKGGSKITTGGSTFGTMAYMSPEQTRGEQVDRRSDVFSFGVVFYEMITRHQPFKGDNAAAIINSILNESPEPLARYKSGVPESCQRLADKALAKDRSERYQHMDDIVADLRRMRKAIEFTESGRVLARAGAHPYRRKLLTFLIPAVAVSAIILFFFVFEPFRLEMGPKTEALATENLLAVMYFDNMPDPVDNNKYSKMITSLLITDLSGSEYLQVVSRQRLYDILKLMGKEGVNTIDRSVATEVASRAGAKWILTGDILQTEPNIVLTSEVSAARTGDILATHRVDGEPGEDLFSVVDRLSAQIKADLAPTDQATAEVDRPVAEVTTHSPEAYRSYLEGLDYSEQLYRAEAEASYKEAIKHDTTFAMAYYRLATLSSGPERRELASKAVKYSDKASKKEKMYIKQFQAIVEERYEDAIDILEKLVKEYPEEKEAFMTLANYYKQIRLDNAKAVEYYNRVVEIDPLYKMAYNMMAYTYNDLGEVEKMLWAINKYIELAPGEANPYDSRGDLLARNGRLDEAIQSYRRAVEIKPDFYYSVRKLGHMYLFKRDYEKAAEYYSMLSSSTDQDWRAVGRESIAGIFMHQGQFAKALEVIDAAITADRMEEAGKSKYPSKFMQKAIIHLERGEIETAIEDVESAMEIVREISPENVVQYLDIHGTLLIMAGRVAEGRAEFDKLDEELSEKGKVYDAAREMTRALRFYAEGNAELAAESADRALEMGLAATMGAVEFGTKYFISQMYLDAGRLAEAVGQLETILSCYDEQRASLPVWSVRSHYLLGQAYERSGWNDKAIEQYETFLRIWEEADPGIAAVEEARERLANLKRIS